MNNSKPNRRDWLVLLFMIILVPLAGEPKMHPFSGDFANFRVSFGSPVFLLFLLWLSNFPRLFTGAVAGIAVMLFRTGLDVFSGEAFLSAFIVHIPNFFYYFIYALFFALPQLSRKSIYEQALGIAFWAIIAEVFASVGELAAMNAIAYQQSETFTLGMLVRLVLIAILRCFFILSFFFLFQLYNTEMRLTRKTKEKDRLTMLIAGLYEEVFELKCSLQNAEAVTHDCYNVYERLKANVHNEEDQTLAHEVLRIAGQCHDIKKNHQRIYAGLQELTQNRRVDDYLTPDKIVKLMIHTQKKYARSLGKEIFFTAKVPKGLPPLHSFMLLSILNNLAANAVEAIPCRGTITLTIIGGTGDGRLLITLENTGSFISPRRLEQVFTPGYTTKFDSNGKASSGVGLTYVKHQTESLGGTINLTSDGKDKVCCHIDLPCRKLHRPSASTKASQHKEIL
ncbi:MAG: ATP-binding protein [Selenomonas sp.]|uniref:sensor histidine kinase n=1 Tax=Selenomonas sp. TaxID=2053611 RepID=UPI0025EE1774|nr:ATP-binding protein [Selenomonas sp.]MCR5757037.1 ATP-binding protein [Selenomonas sp.]